MYIAKKNTMDAIFKKKTMFYFYFNLNVIIILKSFISTTQLHLLDSCIWMRQTRLV